MFFGLNQANASLSFGSEYVYRTNTIKNYPAVAGLKDGEFVVASYYSSNATVEYCQYNSGLTITTCTYETTFNSANTSDIQIARLTDTSFVVVYRDRGNSDYGTAIIGTIGRAGISFGAEYVFHDGKTQHTYVDRLSCTKADTAFLLEPAVDVLCTTSVPYDMTVPEDTSPMIA
jgi:hypothetical protein